jgi:hypothetical protein
LSRSDIIGLIRNRRDCVSERRCIEFVHFTYLLNFEESCVEVAVCNTCSCVDGWTEKDFIEVLAAYMSDQGLVTVKIEIYGSTKLFYIRIQNSYLIAA